MNNSLPGSSGYSIITKQHLYDLMRNYEGKNIDEKLDYVQNYLLSKVSCAEDRLNDFKLKIQRLRHEFKIRWSNSRRTDELFFKKNQGWLQGVVEIPLASVRAGRPPKTFEELSIRSKRRRTQSLRDNIETEELVYATQLKLRQAGKIDASKVLKEVAQSPGRAKKYKEAISDSLSSKNTKLYNLKALSIFVEAGLSRRQYEIVRTSDRKLFPCYSILQKEKKQCYPAPESYTATETLAEVNLQDLLNHTAERLILYLDEVLETLTESECSSLELISKWGRDGSQQSQYKQKFENSTDSHAYIFQVSFVPLRLYCRSTNKSIWQNPTPSSPRYCRPIKISFAKESIDYTQSEISYIESKISALTKTQIQGRLIEVKHTLTFTMIDGKVCNSATNTKSTLKCYICGATSRDFNDLTKSKQTNKDALKFGLSILHARIRFLESLLHLSYKLPIKKWQLRTQEDKDIVKERKAEIQEKLRIKLGLIVDVPKPGFGNSNDGNTSRRFFNNPEEVAEITGVDLQLILRLKVILEVLSSGFRINTSKFSIFAHYTAKLYVELYPWHPMTPTLHKILLHASEVIESALLPIGQLSEEAAEARNKHFRLYRLNFERTFSRRDCNMDVLNRLLLTSDPLISSLRPLRKRKNRQLGKEALEMLISETPDSFVGENTNSMLPSNETKSDEEKSEAESSE